MTHYEKLSVVDLFCGCGGISEGFRQASFDILLGIDCDPWSIRTYNNNHENKGMLARIENMDASSIYEKAGSSRIDVLVGGPPCQAFSRIGASKWRSLGVPSTVAHPLNELYKEFLRIVLEISPKFFVIENVEMMLSIEEGEVKKIVESSLSHKYNVSFFVKDVVNFGVPQHRKRLLVIGNSLGVSNPDLENGYPHGNNVKVKYVTVRDALADLPFLRQNDGKEFMKYRAFKRVSDYAIERRKGSRGVYNHVSRPHNKRDLQIFSKLEPGQNSRWHLPKHMNPYRTDIFRDRYKKQPWDKPSYTILAHLAKDGLMFIHPDARQNRSLTPREAARLQSFDDTYIFEGSRTQQYKQIGNAVPPLFARHIAISVKRILVKQIPLFAKVPAHCHR